MVWLTTNVMEQRIKFVSQALVKGVNFSELCREYVISRPTGYRWVNRYRECGSFVDLEEHSRRPHRSPKRTSLDLEERVLDLRDRHGWGARKLRVVLWRDEGIELPAVTIHRILRRCGKVNRKPGQGPSIQRFERSKSNQLWQMDFKGQYTMRAGKCYPLSILDDHSRYSVGLYGLSNPQGKSVYTSILSCFETYGVPEEMLMDHGTPWWSTTNGHGLTWFSVFLIKQGIGLQYSGYGHPQTQGKVERFHRTLKESVAHRGRPESLGSWRKLLSEFREEYNRVRPHEALDMEVPANRYIPSSKAYNPHPREWEYPEGSVVERLNSQGSLKCHRRRHFVCEALAGERVRVEEIDQLLLISYRNVYIREIDLKSGKTRPLILPGNLL